MPFYSETEKIREKFMPYLKGRVADIGCGGDKIIKSAIGIDGRPLDGVDIVTSDLYNLSKIDGLAGSFNTVHSSHTLEHLIDDTSALLDWSKLLVGGGYLTLYLPDGSKYDNNTNPEHARDYRYDQFLFYFKRVFCGELMGHTGSILPPIFQIIESGEDFGDDRYSFYIIAQKL